MSACELQLGRGTACGGDLFARAAAELVRGDVDLDGQLAVGEHLDERVLAHRTGGHQLVDTDVAALGEQLGDVADVDDLVLGAEPVLKPLSFGSRMWIGIWPPSNVAGTFLRALVPFVPRPAVLPLEPSPRPTRVFAVFEPGAGFRS